MWQTTIASYITDAPPHYQSFINEVHLLFDTPGCDENFNLKLFEQNRRDKGKEQHAVATLHFASSKHPSEILRLSFCSYQTDGQTLYLRGCFPPPFIQILRKLLACINDTVFLQFQGG